MNGRGVNPRRWIPLALFTAAALLSWLLSPALGAGWQEARGAAAALLQPGAAVSGLLDGRGPRQGLEAPIPGAGSPAALAEQLQAAVFLPLWDEDSPAVYLPLVRR